MLQSEKIFAYICFEPNLAAHPTRIIHAPSPGIQKEFPMQGIFPSSNVLSLAEDIFSPNKFYLRSADPEQISVLHFKKHFLKHKVLKTIFFRGGGCRLFKVIASKFFFLLF